MIMLSIPSLDENFIPTMQVRNLGEAAQFECRFIKPNRKRVEWYWNNMLVKLAFYHTSRVKSSFYYIPSITHGDAGIYECRVDYIIGHRKVFTTAAVGKLLVTGMKKIYLTKTAIFVKRVIFS